MYQKEGGAVGAFIARIGDILGCGDQDVLSRIQTFLEARPGKLELQEASFAHAGLEVSHANDYSARLAQAGFSSELTPLDTSGGFITPGPAGSSAAFITPGGCSSLSV